MSLREFISSVIMLNGLTAKMTTKKHEKLPSIQRVEYIFNDMLYVCIAWGRKGCLFAHFVLGRIVGIHDLIL